MRLYKLHTYKATCNHARTGYNKIIWRLQP
uniref:Uncharacterized protein n=2 Tax=unclassified Caudoviricetes TaxID=2788787 RepID=A0A8S5Q7Y4_9CAUD|nr:MAG TPA: hypothetical protein [Siphoviridae sp. ctAvK3]DAE15152.1 MAG TPA: hypothetical protein [Siphoviridae sp. ctdVv30]